MNKKTIVICGPTASGKTKLGIHLAQALNGEIISADSMQIYRGMDIGTAKPTLEEREGIPHHMLDVADPSEAYSVSRYVTEADACVQDILTRGRVPIIVGGTGLYIDSLCQGLHFAAEGKGTAVREALQAQLAREGRMKLWEQLSREDPEASARIHPNDERRVLRALEVLQTSGRSITEHNRETRAQPPRYESLRIGLSFTDRADLRERINQRVDLMMQAGLWEEVSALVAAGLPAGCTAMQAIGYKELLTALEGIRSPEEAVAEMKLRSGQYAKRQLSWFRRNESIHWIHFEKSPNFSKALQNSMLFLQKEGLG